jgi:hypothetical protein
MKNPRSAQHAPVGVQYIEPLRFLFLLLLIFVLFLGGESWGYEEGPVTEGGTLTGKVILKGTPPPARIYHLIFSPNIDFCIRVSDGRGNRLLKEFRVSEEGGLQDAIVAVLGVEKGKPFDHTPEIKIEDCRIAPFVTPVRNRHPIFLINNDPVMHNIQGYTLTETNGATFYTFNAALGPEEIDKKEIRMRKGHYIFRTQCGQHDFMQSWGIAVGNPYFAVTGLDGSFTIDEIPPGEYHVIAWHPHMKMRAGRIVVSPGGEVKLDFEFEASEVKIPLHDLQTEYRLENYLQPDRLVPPAVELQVP